MDDALPADDLVLVVFSCQHHQAGLNDTAAKAQHEVKRRLFLRKG